MPGQQPWGYSRAATDTGGLPMYNMLYTVTGNGCQRGIETHAFMHRKGTASFTIIEP